MDASFRSTRARRAGRVSRGAFAQQSRRLASGRPRPIAWDQPCAFLRAPARSVATPRRRRTPPGGARVPGRQGSLVQRPAGAVARTRRDRPGLPGRKKCGSMVASARWREGPVGVGFDHDDARVGLHRATRFAVGTIRQQRPGDEDDQARGARDHPHPMDDAEDSAQTRRRHSQSGPGRRFICSARSSSYRHRKVTIMRLGSQYCVAIVS